VAHGGTTATRMAQGGWGQEEDGIRGRRRDYDETVLLEGKSKFFPPPWFIYALITCSFKDFGFFSRGVVDFILDRRHFQFQRQCS
jgi:hypothetical protein